MLQAQSLECWDYKWRRKGREARGMEEGEQREETEKLDSWVPHTQTNQCFQTKAMMNLEFVFTSHGYRYHSLGGLK